MCPILYNISSLPIFNVHSLGKKRIGQSRRESEGYRERDKKYKTSHCPFGDIFLSKNQNNNKKNVINVFVFVYVYKYIYMCHFYFYNNSDQPFVRLYIYRNYEPSNNITRLRFISIYSGFIRTILTRICNCKRKNSMSTHFSYDRNIV